tara:strand:- start:289 stop:498 length:210 start_codon:yes stop_codon:yes gene_type:complete
MDNFNISLSLDTDSDNENNNYKNRAKSPKRSEKKEKNILPSIQDLTENTTTTAFIVSIVSHMIINSMKK